MYASLDRVIIGSDNGLSPVRRQAIIWTNAGILLIGPLGTNFIEILIEILTFSLEKMRFKVSSAKRWQFCLGLNVLKYMKCMQYLGKHRELHRRKKMNVHTCAIKYISICPNSTIFIIAELSIGYSVNWGPIKMAVLMQTTFPNTILYMKSVHLDVNFTEDCS